MASPRVQSFGRTDFLPRDTGLVETFDADNGNTGKQQRGTQWRNKRSYCHSSKGDQYTRAGQFCCARIPGMRAYALSHTFLSLAAHLGLAGRTLDFYRGCSAARVDIVEILFFELMDPSAL